MARAVVFLDQDLVSNIEKLYEGSDKTLSKIIVELARIGYKVKQHHESQGCILKGAKESNLEDRHTEYLLRIMAMVADTYRCVHNEKSKYKEENIETVLNKIACRAQDYIDEQLNRSSEVAKKKE